MFGCLGSKWFWMKVFWMKVFLDEFFSILDESVPNRGRCTDFYGHHRATCAQSGVLARRGFAVESVGARVCRDVSTNIMVPCRCLASSSLAQTTCLQQCVSLSKKKFVERSTVSFQQTRAIRRLADKTEVDLRVGILKDRDNLANAKRSNFSPKRDLRS